VRFEELTKALPKAVFDLPFLRQSFGIRPEDDAALSVQLSRWAKAGKIHILRKGLYALVGRDTPNALVIANRLVEPSYISGEYALSYYGLIPESVFTITSGCLRAPRQALAETPYGNFSYRQVKVMDGFDRFEIGGDKISFATLEKALVDTWHWLRGAWTPKRHAGMRYGDRDLINPDRLRDWAKKFESPRLVKAAETFLALG
jgi:predicted transcriptional regulator of viral defense system